MELVVINAPSQQSVKQNVVYLIHPIPSEYVSVISKSTNYVFKQKQCDNLLAAQIGINAIQRRSLKISCGEKVTVRSFRADDIIAALATAVKLDCKNFVSDEHVKVQELSSHLARTYQDQIWTTGQSLAIDVMGHTVILTVLNIYRAPSPGKPSQIERAVLRSDTEFILSTDCQRLHLDSDRATPVLKTTDINFASLGIGGLDDQLAQIFRRAFASRLISAETVQKLGIRHVKGILLHGIPGSGKTLIARRLSGLLTGKKPKLVNGPEILNKYVGASEENVRKLFADAEEDQRKGVAGLHVIILDEIDAICKTRGTSKSDVNVHDTIVNQLLSKMDGVDALDNILLIGMTNRKDIIDPALVRPGRFELQIEIGLPSEKGRLQILQIHTRTMSENSFLHDSAASYLTALAANTMNFTGAELQGLVNCAVSYALEKHSAARADDENIRIMKTDFEKALYDIRPAFGISHSSLTRYHQWGMISYGARYEEIVAQCGILTKSLTDACTPFAIIILGMVGPRCTGKTSLAAWAGLNCGYPFVKMISLDQILGLSDTACIQIFRSAFADATKSNLAMIILDDIGLLPRLNRGALEAVTVLLRTPPPIGHKLFVVCTCLDDHNQLYDLQANFDHVCMIPELTIPEAQHVLSQTNTPEDVQQETLKHFASTVPIKKLLQTQSVVTTTLRTQ